MLHSIALQPLPVPRCPPARIVVAAGCDELGERGIGDVMSFDREARDLFHLRRELVVPAERHRAAFSTQTGTARGNLDPFRCGQAAVDAWLVSGGPALLLERQAMPDIEKRLLMHRLMFEDGIHR